MKNCPLNPDEFPCSCRKMVKRKWICDVYDEVICKLKECALEDGKE